MKKYKLIGLTGTTGSGKGEAVKIFLDAGYAVIDADLLARKIMEKEVVLKNIAGFFGEDLVKNNVPDRKKLAQRAFKNKENTALLNSITHPYITALFVEEVKALVQKGETKILFDAPQLFESSLDVLCDCVVAVVADRETRINRIVQRDNLSYEKALERVNAQFSDEFFKENCDCVAENNSDLNSFSEDVKKIISNL